MIKSGRRAFVAWVAAAVAVGTISTMGGAAQAAPPTDKEPQGPAAKADPRFLEQERAAGRGVVSTDESRAALTEVQSRVRAYVAKNGTEYTFGTYSDPRTGDVVVDSDAPDEVVAPLTDLKNKGLGHIKVKVNKGRVHDGYNRKDDIAPFFGGGGLSASGALCSSGYAVKNSAGTRYMTTAGHCFANGTTVRTESGARVVGVVTGRALASLGSGPVDMELLRGQSYAGRIFVGGTTSSSSLPVVSAGSATVGYSAYCHSGRTTGEHCGHTATSVTAQVCTGTGCKSPVIAFTGGVLPQGGDSGSPFYAKNSTGAYIRGHVIAVGSSTAYAELWSKVASRYGVTIVTG